MASYRRFLRAGSDQHEGDSKRLKPGGIPWSRSALMLSVCFVLWGFSSLVPIQRMGLTLAAVVGMSVWAIWFRAGTVGGSAWAPCGFALPAESDGTTRCGSGGTDVLPLTRKARPAGAGDEGVAKGVPRGDIVKSRWFPFGMRAASSTVAHRRLGAGQRHAGRLPGT